jgi:bacillithiol biosynthesis cysteine-adding enzyme BshC
MKVDASLVRLLDEMAGQLNVLPFGSEIVRLLQQCYAIGTTIQNATFRLVHALFKKFGLLVLIADHVVLKKLMLPIFEDDLFQQTPSYIVEETCQRLSEAYNVQANPREINLFYLADGIRNRIVGQGDSFHVHDTALRFTAAELKAELQQYPERFSPNVILRGLFQETILPNVAFIGGGGELAYWLQLKDLFLHYQVAFPVLVLRNSVLIVDKKEKERIEKWKLHHNDLFQPELHIIDSVLKGQGKLPQLNGEVEQLAAVYEDLKKLASTVDVTLHKHVEALKTGSLRQLQNLQRKLMRAERRKHDVLLQQVQQLKKSLFPNNGLQERMENVSSFYARHGSEFIDEILEHSPALETQFTILTAV